MYPEEKELVLVEGFEAKILNVLEDIEIKNNINAVCEQFNGQTITIINLHGTY